MKTIFLSLILSLTASAFALSPQMERRLLDFETAHPEADMAAFRREADYESQDLPTSERARLEGVLLLRQVKEATLSAYQAERRSTRNTDAAKAEVRRLAQRAQEQLNPALVPDVNRVVEETLANPGRSSSGGEVVSRELLAALTASSNARRTALGFGGSSLFIPTSARVEQDTGADLTLDGLGVLAYRDRAHLAQALASSVDASERWVSTSNINLTSERETGYSEKITLQVKAEFMGVEIAAGPIIEFRRTITSRVTVRGEGMYPLVDAHGVFDLVARDDRGRPLASRTRRFAFLVCELEAHVDNQAGMAGGFRLGGVGGEVRQISALNQYAALSSRQVLVPDTIGGRRVTLAVLAEVCHREFVNARMGNGATVKQSLDTSIAALFSSLVYVNSALDCVLGEHCRDWFSEQHPFLREVAIPACVPARNPRQVTACAMRGVDGARCAVMHQGRRLTSGFMELECAEGFRCVSNIPGATRPRAGLLGHCREISGSRR